MIFVLASLLIFSAGECAPLSEQKAIAPVYKRITAKKRESLATLLPKLLSGDNPLLTKHQNQQATT